MIKDPGWWWCSLIKSVVDAYYWELSILSSEAPLPSLLLLSLTKFKPLFKSSSAASTSRSPCPPRVTPPSGNSIHLTWDYNIQTWSEISGFWLQNTNCLVQNTTIYYKIQNEKQYYDHDTSNWPWIVVIKITSMINRLIGGSKHHFSLNSLPIDVTV